MLVGCWGKIGDIIHTVPVAQFLGATLVYDPMFAAVGPLLDLLPIEHYAEAVDWAADDLGIPGAVNCSHNQFRKDPLRGLNIIDWWNIGKHSIDFHAAWCGITLSGEDRLLRFPRWLVRQKTLGMVTFMSNCADPGMRGYPDAFMQELGVHLQDRYGVFEVSRGETVVGTDLSRFSLGDVVRQMAASKLIVSVDTMATGIIAQSLNVPIVRLYTGHTRNTGTGPTVDWPGCRAITGPNSPADVYPLMDGLLEEWWSE